LSGPTYNTPTLKRIEEAIVKFIDEYRDARAARRYAQAIANITTQPWNIMEVCGRQTHAIVKYGIDELLYFASCGFVNIC
jgi:hypothetical protein